MSNKTNSELKVGAFLSYFQIFLGSLISILYTPIMLRILGQNEYGLLSLAMSVTSYLGLLSFGLGTSYVRFNSEYRVNGDKDGEYNLNGMYFVVFIIIGLISFICGMILVLNTESIFSATLNQDEIAKAKILIFIAVVNLSISLPMSIFSLCINAYEKFFWAKIIGILTTVLNPLVTLPLLLLGFRSIALTVVAFGISIIAIIANSIYAKKIGFKMVFRSFDFSLMKTIYVFSFYIFLNSIVDQINWSIDKFLLGMFSGTIAVAIYAIGGQFNTYFVSFANGISGVFTPRINQMILKNQKNELTYLFTKIGRIQFIILTFVLVGYIIFGEKFIEMWAGTDYKNSYYIGLLLMLSTLIPLIQNTGIAIQQAMNKHKFRSVMMFAMAIFNLGLSVVLVQLYGGIGAAFGTFLTVLLMNGVIMNVYYHKAINLDIKFFWKEISKLLPSIILALFFGLILRFYFDFNDLYVYVSTGIIYVVFFVCLVWFLGMNNFEKNLIKSPIKKFLLKRRGH